MLQPILQSTRKNHQSSKGHEKIKEAGQHRRHGENLFGEIDFHDQFTIAGEAVACEADTGDEKRPGDGLHGHAGDVGRLERRA